MGTPDQKLLIAFKCFDLDNEDEISPGNLSLVLKHIPSHYNSKYGISILGEDQQGFVQSNDAHKTIFNLNQKKIREFEEIRQLTELIFSQYKDVIYFNEFKYIA